MDKNKAIEPVISAWRKTNHPSGAPRQKQRALTPEQIAHSKRIEDAKNALTYKEEKDPFDM